MVEENDHHRLLTGRKPRGRVLNTHSFQVSQHPGDFEASQHPAQALQQAAGVNGELTAIVFWS